MLKGFLEEIPLEIEEAALVDGASRWHAFRHILLPLARTGSLPRDHRVRLRLGGIPVRVHPHRDPAAMTFPVGVQGLVTQFEIIWNDMAAAAVIAIAVPLALMILARRYVITGLTFGVIRDK